MTPMTPLHGITVVALEQAVAAPLPTRHLADFAAPGTPSKVGISVAAIAAGMYAYSGILTALFARANTGEGTALEVSLFDALSEWMSPQAAYTAGRGAPPPRSGPDHASIAPYELFQ